MNIKLRSALAGAILLAAAAAVHAGQPATCAIVGNENSDGVGYNQLVNYEQSVLCCPTPACCNASCADCNNECGTPACESCANFCDVCCCDPVWTVQAGAVILNRSPPKSEQIIHPVGSSTTVSSGADFGFDWSAGPDITIDRRMASGNIWQVRYFGALDFNAAAAYGAVGNVQIGSFSNFGATNLTADYNSLLNSAEINWLHPLGDRVTWLVGFRWTELEDALRYRITFPAFNAVYRWNENNQLFGAQTGFDLSLWNLTGPFTVDCLMKAGVYGNSATNNFNLNPSTGGSFPGGANDTGTAFIGELGITAAYQFTRHLAVRGGYELVWIDGVALSSNEAAAATVNHTQNAISTQGDAFYHGALVSLEVLW